MIAVMVPRATMKPKTKIQDSSFFSACRSINHTKSAVNLMISSPTKMEKTKLVAIGTGPVSSLPAGSGRVQSQH